MFAFFLLLLGQLCAGSTWTERFSPTGAVKKWQDVAISHNGLIQTAVAYPYEGYGNIWTETGAPKQRKYNAITFLFFSSWL